MVRILGISAYYHDSAACLVEDGRIVAAAQEERFTRKKHDAGFPARAIEYCLREAGIDLARLDLVGFYEKPLVKLDRLLETYVACAPRGLRSYLMAAPLWLGEKLWMADDIRSRLSGYKGEVLFGEHHESHAASAFYPSPFEQAAIVTMDGVGECATSSIGVGRGADIDLLHELRFPHSLGLLYSAFTHYTGFKVNSGEYKVMGLAPYGEPRYVKAIKDHLLEIHDDGSVWMNMEYFTYASALTMTGGRFDALFGGPPRTPESKLTQREMDLARSIQDVAEEAMLKMAAFVDRGGCRARQMDRATLPACVAALLAAGKVVGLLQGRMEFGPRALGARSILGDPRSPAMQALMNVKIKFRESFRPFAPSVLRERAREWFDLDGDSPYMLLVADVLPGRRLPAPSGAAALWGIDRLNVPRSTIPAVTHVDYSARIQTVRRETHPVYYDILDAFDR